MIVSKTPYRLSLFGGGSDYPAWYNENPSKVLSAAMNHHCYIHVKQLPPFHEHPIRIVYSKIENVNSVDEIEHPSIRACLKFLNITEGISIGHEGDLPARSGIGSSSSFTVGLLNALYKYKNIYKTQLELAQDAIHVEQKIIGESVGIQDQIMAAHGGLKIIDMSSQGWNINYLKTSPDYIDRFQDHVLLGFSGISRFSEVQAKKQITNIVQGTSVDTLKKMQLWTNIAIEAFEKQLEIRLIGEILNETWKLKRGLAEGVSTDVIDTIYNTAIKAGAYGGKLMGAGGGGFFMFIAPPDKHEEIKNKVKQINVWVPFKFDHDGSQIIMG